MRVPSVAPCGAVPWVPSNEVQRGERNRGNTVRKGESCIKKMFL